MEELKITKEDIDLLKEMKDNCLKTNVYDDEKRLLKANAITKFLVEYEEKQELIDYLKEEIKLCKKAQVIALKNKMIEQIGNFNLRIASYEEILSKIETSDN